MKAFPSTFEYFPNDKSCDEEHGMDLRDYFAAKALQGLLVTRNDAAYLEKMPEICYKWADAMMKARDK